MVFKALWQKLWLLFAVIWVVVAGLQVGSILAFAGDPEKALPPLFYGIAVPATAYFVVWLWFRWRGPSKE
ncbi:MAG: hypothetical protein QOD26_3508 [Betaproteobacteria bacterium]|nr:hypothetical protein [Betaproteobacteria bacterium]